MSFYFGIDFLRQPVNGVAWPVRVLVAVVAVPIAADTVLLFAPVGRVFGQKGGQDGAVVAEKGAHLLLNGQNVFAEQLGGEVLFSDMAVVVAGVQAVEHGALDGVE